MPSINPEIRKREAIRGEEANHAATRPNADPRGGMALATLPGDQLQHHRTGVEFLSSHISDGLTDEVLLSEERRWRRPALT